MRRRKIHTWVAMRKIANKIKQVKDKTALWYKVNWIIIDTSHKIYKRRDAHGHRVRQKIRHRLWDMAQQKYPILRKYIIPREIEGNSACNIKSGYKAEQKPLSLKRSIGQEKKYSQKNIPALVAATIIGIFLILIPIIDRKTLYENIFQNLAYINPESFSNVIIILSMFLALVIFGLFLLNGLGYITNRYSKYAGYLSILYLSLVLLENVLFIKNTNQIPIFGVINISYWIASLGISIIGIVYLIFFETINRDKKNRWKITSFTISCAITLILIGIFMPIVSSSIGLSMTENFGAQSFSVNSKYHVGEIATDNNGQQGVAIISDDGQGHYTIVPVFLDYSQKGWHTNGKVDPQIVTYQSVEQRYPVEWAGGRMDISHIPDRDPTYIPSGDSSSTNVASRIPISITPTTTQKTMVTTVPINEIVDKHNYYRSTVSGANIPNLLWSSALATSAQNWAHYLGTNNLFQHSSGNSENIAAGYSSWTAAIDGWGSEKSNFIYAPFGNGASKTGNWKDVGHYTQMIWKTTSECGCGNAPHPTYGTVYVCHYAPAGNILGYYPY